MIKRGIRGEEGRMCRCCYERQRAKVWREKNYTKEEKKKGKRKKEKKGVQAVCGVDWKKGWPKIRLDDRVWRDCWRLSVRLLWVSLLAILVHPPLRRRTEVAGCVALHGQTLLQVAQHEEICQSGVYFSESACICGWSSGANALQRGQCFAGPMLLQASTLIFTSLFLLQALPGG